MKPVGESVLNVIKPKFNTVHATNFMVVRDNFDCLLSLSTDQELILMMLTTIVLLPILICFGDFGTINLKLDKDVGLKLYLCVEYP